MKKLIILIIFFCSINSFAQVEFTEHFIDTEEPRNTIPLDLDKDGAIDLISSRYAPNELIWYKNDGNQSFEKNILISDYVFAESIKVVDFDNDNDIDVFGISYPSPGSYYLTWYENDGNQNFIRHELINVVGSTQVVDVKDLDQNGELDIIVTETQNQLIWYKNNGNYNFEKIIIDNSLSGFTNQPQIYIADIDKINGLDIVYASNSTGDLAWYKNDGNQTFTKTSIDSGYSQLNFITPVDLDSDNDLDLVISSFFPRGIYWYENDGSQNFNKRIINEESNLLPIYLEVADLNNDGKKDIVSTDFIMAYYVGYENDGSQSFTKFAISNLYLSGLSKIKLLDIDSDNDVDIIIDDFTGNKTYWFENNYTPPIVEEPIGKCYNQYENLNWISNCTFDLSGRLTSSGVSYFNSLGKATQSQSTDIKTGRIWASQTLYDFQGRPAFQSLSAPVGEIDFGYKNFVLKSNGTALTTADIESITEENANLPLISDQENTLGWYYSENNNREPYQDITANPYAKAVYSKLNPGEVLKTLGGNKVDIQGEDKWLNGYSFSMPVAQELFYTFGKDNFPIREDLSINYGDLGLIGIPYYINAKKTVIRDVHGVESVIFNDAEGNTLAAARSGNEENAGLPQYEVVSTIGEQGFVDIHIPVGCGGPVLFEGKSGTAFTIYDLITEELVNTTNILVGTSFNLDPGMYRIEEVTGGLTNNPSYVTVNNSTISLLNTSKAAAVRYNDYSLNYYDKANRLVQSVQPLGFDNTNLINKTFNTPNHTYISTFAYNSLGQLQQSTSPDEGTARFKYRADGQIRFSQNSKQLATNEFSYTNYDLLGRPIESGVAEGADFEFADPDDGLLPMGAFTKEEHFTLYDEPELAEMHAALTAEGISTTFYTSQQFVSGNVSKTYTQNPNTSTTWYSYDVYGRVQWLIQKIDGLGTKTIDYEYDQTTGEVTKVWYQKYKPAELFIHQYKYNIAGQLVAVATSSDDNNYTTQANYEYYETGALKRTVLAEDLQGIDYVYNLAGQLKAINSPNLGTTDANLFKDPGNDGNNGVAQDVFGMALDYYYGDYRRSSTHLFDFLLSSYYSQYNGNIGLTRWNTQNNITPDYQNAHGYYYNKNNWLKDAVFYYGNPANGVGKLLGNYNYASTYRYDTNGNFSFLRRKGFDPAATLIDYADYNQYPTPTIDQLTYSYKPGTNQLDHVTDAVTTPTNADDIKTQTPGNYTYNSIGQLINNTEEGISYTYNASGLVTEVSKTTEAFPNGYPLVSFYYNDKGHRVKKRNWVDEIDTYYVRDVAGTVMAIYNSNNLTEIPIYGASRLGIHYKQSGVNAYQLTDHLGNVRAVVMKDGQNAVSLTSTADYYPFGMPMPGRQTIGGELYRYAFQGQEKDPETGKEAFQLRLWDSRIGRWLSPDPYKEFPSPYLGMGNTPNMTIDSDGGCTDPPCDVDGGMLDEVIVVARGNGQMTSELNSQYDYGGTFAQWQVQYGYDGIDYNNARALWESQDNGAWAAQVAQWDRDGRNQVLLGKLQFFTGPFKASEDLAEVLPGNAAVNTTRSAIRAFKYIPRFKVKIHVKIHGNSLDSPRPTWFYKLYNVDGTFLKNGITSEIIPQARYTKKFMSTHKMGDLQLFPNRRGAYDFEFLQNTIEPGPLNLNMH